MGMDPDAKLVFGIKFGYSEDEGRAQAHPFYGVPGWGKQPEYGEDGNEIESDDDDYENEETFVASHLFGITRPDVEWVDKNTDPEGYEAVYAVMKVFWDAQREALKGLPTVESGGTYEFVSYALIMPESKTLVEWSDIAELGNTISPKPEWRDQLKDFCDKMGIEWREPQWLLMAFYG